MSKLREIVNRIVNEELVKLNEMPSLKRIGKKVVDASTGVELKKISNSSIENENLVFYVADKATFMFDAGWFMMWMYTEPNATDSINKGESDMLLFPPKISFTASPIDDIWKKKKYLKNVESVIGATQGWIDNEKKEVFIMMISVRPGWRRNGVSSHIMKGLHNLYPSYKFITSKQTANGKAFFASVTDKPDEDTSIT